MKVYELKLQKGGKGVFRMSTVKNPAIDDTLLFFKKEEEDISYFIDEEKQIFYAPAMIPRKMIFRKDVNGEPAEVFYNENFVEEALINYYRNNGNSQNNINHSDENVEGLFPFESWIVKNSKNDKATELGFNVPNGTLMMGYKVDNTEVWKNVKEGKLDGLSIEATNLDRILKKDIKMNKDTKNKKGVINFIKEGFNKLFEDAEKFEGQVAEVSKWWQNVVNDTFAIGDTVTRKFGEGKTQEVKPIGAGEYELEDGRKILTDSEGIIRYIFEATTPATPVPAETPAPAATPVPAETPATKSDKTVGMASETPVPVAPAETPATPATPATPVEPTENEQKLLNEIIDLKATIAQLEADKVKAKTDLEKMSKQTPAATKIPITPTTENHKKEKSYEKMTNYEKVVFNREN